MIDGPICFPFERHMSTSTGVSGEREERGLWMAACFPGLNRCKFHLQSGAKIKKKNLFAAATTIFCLVRSEKMF